MVDSAHIQAGSTVDPAEIERFARIAEEWWDPRGKFAPLHRLNPVRLGFIRDHAAAHWQRDPLSGTPLQGLSLVDIGCGSVDAGDLGADGQELAIDYRETTAEALADTGAQFDIVLALEIVEHVADVDLFLHALSRLAKPGGLVFLSTLNRTAKAFALAIAGAEYVMRWLPRGTHDWRKFLKPSELVRGLRHVGIEPQEIAGVIYSPLSREWSLHKRDLDVNYMLYGSKGVG